MLEYLTNGLIHYDTFPLDTRELQARVINLPLHRTLRALALHTILTGSPISVPGDWIPFSSRREVEFLRERQTHQPLPQIIHILHLQDDDLTAPT